MKNIDEKTNSMNEQQSAIYAILETTSLGIEAAKSLGIYSSVQMHLNAFREFIDKGKDAGLDAKMLAKYESVFGGVN